MYIGELDVKPFKKRKRVGRGPGSGNGKTAGRGHKGQGARSGFKKRPWFEGGQMPLQRRLPKRGFHSRNRVEFQLVKIASLANFNDGQTVDPAAMQAAGLIKYADRRVKILGDGDLSVKLTVQADAFSKSAQQKIAQAGGDAVVREAAAQ